VKKAFLTIWVVYLGLINVSGGGETVAIEPQRMGRIPKLMLWAWERPEDLRFINPEGVGIAYLATTITIRRGKVSVHPRLQRLQFPPNCVLVGVARIEIIPTESVLQQESTAVTLASTILTSVPIERIKALQIDFDARKAERGLYQEVLVRLRSSLPDSVGLSITALASWCLDDNWLAGLPIDEAVPMLFRMGVDHHEIAQQLHQGRDFRLECSSSVGLSVDEQIVRMFPDRRAYIFNPKPWSKPVFDAVVQQIKGQ